MDADPKNTGGPCWYNRSSEYPKGDSGCHEPREKTLGGVQKGVKMTGNQSRHAEQPKKKAAGAIGIPTKKCDRSRFPSLKLGKKEKRRTAIKSEKCSETAQLVEKTAPERMEQEPDEARGDGGAKDVTCQRFNGKKKKSILSKNWRNKGFYK